MATVFQKYLDNHVVSFIEVVTKPELFTGSVLTIGTNESQPEYDVIRWLSFAITDIKLLGLCLHDQTNKLNSLHSQNPIHAAIHFNKTLIAYRHIHLSSDELITPFQLDCILDHIELVQTNVEYFNRKYNIFLALLTPWVHLSEASLNKQQRLIIKEDYYTFFKLLKKTPFATSNNTFKKFDVQEQLNSLLLSNYMGALEVSIFVLMICYLLYMAVSLVKKASSPSIDMKKTM